MEPTPILEMGRAYGLRSWLWLLIWSDKITNERVARVGYNHFISNKGEWNNCFSKFSNIICSKKLTVFLELRSRKTIRKFPSFSWKYSVAWRV